MISHIRKLAVFRWKFEHTWVISQLLENFLVTLGYFKPNAITGRTTMAGITTFSRKIMRHIKYYRGLVQFFDSWGFPTIRGIAVIVNWFSTKTHEICISKSTSLFFFLLKNLLLSSKTKANYFFETPAVHTLVAKMFGVGVFG